jgi:hypothetical protein
VRQLTPYLRQHPRAAAAVAVAGVVLVLYLRRMKVSAAVAAKLAAFPAYQRGRFSELLAEFEARSFTVVITSGYRAGENSLHGKWRALDLNVIDAAGKWYKMATPKAEWEATGLPALIRARSMRWGGDFVTPWRGLDGKMHVGYDPVHIDLGY